MAEAFAPEDLTEDGFLGGRLRLLQPRAGFRAGTDSVMLAAAVPARPGQRVLELGAGAGVASLCLAARVAGLDLAAVERQPAYAALARSNAARAGIALWVVCADLADLPADLRLSFDHVLANPPFFAPGAGSAAQDAGREAALREGTPLAVWIETAQRRLAPGGWLTMIHLAERLPDVLAALRTGFGSTGGGNTGFGAVAVLPIAARQGRAAGRVILRARKGGRAPFQLLAPFVLHDGARHLRDGGDLSQAAQAVLAGGGALDFTPGSGIRDRAGARSS